MVYGAIVVIGVLVVAAVVILWRRGARQTTEVEVSAFGAKARMKNAIEPEMENIKAGRDVKALSPAGDPARMKEIEAGRDVIRDTRGGDPKK